VTEHKTEYRIEKVVIPSKFPELDMRFDTLVTVSSEPLAKRVYAELAELTPERVRLMRVDTKVETKYEILEVS
jgi:hypothetical protein